MPNKEEYAKQPGFESPANKGRFEKYLDHKQALIYKRTDTWDRHPIEVGLLIPKGIDWSKNVGILVKWHGGALVSFKPTCIYIHPFSSFRNSPMSFTKCRYRSMHSCCFIHVTL